VVLGEHLQLAVAAGGDRIAFLDAISNMRNARLPLVINNSNNALDEFDMGEPGRC
jgi:hypothetical protein